MPNEPTWMDWIAKYPFGEPPPSARAASEAVIAGAKHLGSLGERAIKDVGLQTFHGREPDIGTVLEAATLPMGGTAFSGAKGAALGAGPATFFGKPTTPHERDFLGKLMEGLTPMEQAAVGRMVKNSGGIVTDVTRLGPPPAAGAVPKGPTLEWFERRAYHPPEITDVKQGISPASGSGVSPLPKKVDPETQKVLDDLHKQLDPHEPYVPVTVSTPAKWETFFTPLEIELIKAHAPMGGANIKGMFDADKILTKAYENQALREAGGAQGPSQLASGGLTPAETQNLLQPGGYVRPSTRYPDPFDVPREAPFKLPEVATEQGYNVKAVHGTRNPPYDPNTGGWSYPNRLEKDFDRFRLPPTEIGVHFGGPRAAGNFTTSSDLRDISRFPRKFPVGIQAQNPLELRDLGSWGPSKMASALKAKGFPADEVDRAIGGGYHAGQSSETQIQGLRKYLQDKGYDSIKYRNNVEDPGSTSYILFTPSADAPNYVRGVRSPWAKFDPSKMGSSDIGAALAATVGLGGLASGEYKRKE